MSEPARRDDLTEGATGSERGHPDIVRAASDVPDSSWITVGRRRMPGQSGVARAVSAIVEELRTALRRDPSRTRDSAGGRAADELERQLDRARRLAGIERGEHHLGRLLRVQA